MKDEVKQIIKMIVSQTFTIATVLLFVMGMLRISFQDFSAWEWYFPFQILGVSFPTALCSLVFLQKHEITRKQFIIRCVIHFILLTTIVLGEGFLFKWWSELSGIIIVFIVFLFVYVIVWIITYIGDRKSADGINQALKNKNTRQDDEC